MTYVNVLNDIPAEITAGESVSWLKSLSDYPASDSWVLTYSLVKSDNQIQIVAAADGDDHLIEIPIATSTDYEVGDYAFQAHVSNGTERYQVDSGKIEIVADFAAQGSGYDSRTMLEKQIDALDAAIYGRASKTQLMQTISGMQIQHMDLEKQRAVLKDLRSQLAHRNWFKTGGKDMGVKF